MAPTSLGLIFSQARDHLGRLIFKLVKNSFRKQIRFKFSPTKIISSQAVFHKLPTQAYE